MARDTKKIERLNAAKAEWEQALELMTPSEKLRVAQEFQEKHHQEKLKLDFGTRQELGRSDDVGAKAVGLSKSYLAQIKAVVDAARDDPKKYGKFAEEMDQTGDFRTAYVNLRRAMGYRRRPVKLKESTKSGWIIYGNGKVIIVNQVQGKKPTGEVNFSTREFDKIARWYLKERGKK